jgi:microcystin-dependent protein
MIILWSGTTGTIPTGWALCNGGNGTPNLTDKFIVGAGNAYGVSETGGYKDATLVSHNHTGSTGGAGGHSHTYSKPSGSSSFQSGGTIGGGTAITGSSSTSTSSVGNHTHSVSISTKGSSGTNKNLPPYYALAYIMRL